VLAIHGQVVYCNMPVDNFIFKAKVPERYSEELNRLFYFNGYQAKYAKKIIRSVELYGKPVLVSDSNLISMELESENKGQCLFMLTDEGEEALLMGTLLYSRISAETIVITHLVVNETATEADAKEFSNIVYLFIRKLVSIASKIKDVGEIILPYSEKKKIKLKK